MYGLDENSKLKQRQKVKNELALEEATFVFVFPPKLYI